MAKNPLQVSIVLPTYNGERYIREAITSCLEQSYTDIELIIVDDCSDDGTAGIIGSFNDARIKYIRHERNEKLPAALNTGFAHSSGGYLTWISDDNYFSLNAVEALMDVFKEHPDIDVVYSAYYELYRDGHTRLITPGQPRQLTIYNAIGPSFIYKRNVYEQIGGYRPEKYLVEDYDYWLRIYAQDFRFFRLHYPFYYYRVYSRTLTATKSRTIVRKSSGLKIKFITDTNKFDKKEKSLIFLANAREILYGYRFAATKSLCLAVINDPFVLFSTEFYFIVAKLIIGPKFVKLLRRKH